MKVRKGVVASITLRVGLVATALLAASGQTDGRPAAHAMAAPLPSTTGAARFAAAARGIGRQSLRVTHATAPVRPIVVPDVGIVGPGLTANALIPRPSVAGSVPISVTVSLPNTRVASLNGKSTTAWRGAVWTRIPGTATTATALRITGVANGVVQYKVVEDAARQRFVGTGSIYVGSTLQAALGRVSVGAGYMTRVNLALTGAVRHMAGLPVLTVSVADPSIASVASYMPVTLTDTQPSVPVFISGNRAGTTTLAVQAGLAISGTATMSSTSTIKAPNTVQGSTPVTPTAVQAGTPLSPTVALQAGTILSTTITLNVVAAPPPPPFILQTNPISVTGQFSLASPARVACGSAPAAYSETMVIGQLADLFTISVPSDIGAVNYGSINPDGSFTIQRDGETYTGRIDQTGAGFATNAYGYGACAWTYHLTFTPLPRK